MKFMFSKGDEVVLTTLGQQNVDGIEADDTVTVVQVGHRIGGRDWMNYCIEIRNEDGDLVDRTYVRSQWIKKVTQGPAQNGNSNMSAFSELAAKVKALARSADDKLLIKYGAMSETGESTREGRRLMTEILFEENKAVLVAKLEALKADEEKSSKKK